MKSALNKFTHLLDPGDSKKKYFFIFTILFAVLALISFSWFIFSGRTLIWEVDGWTQHYTALVYYGRFLRSIVKSVLINHEFVIPEWEFALGEGGDIVNTLHYYVIGEPLNLLSVFVPSGYTYFLYSFLMIFRIYLAGLSFSLLCFGTEIKNYFAVLAGAVAYSFSGWALLCVCLHPFFITPLIYLPILILGTEQIFKKKKPYILIVGIVLTAVSNFYFFYMQVLIVVIYCFVRTIVLYKKDIKNIVISLLRIAVPSVIAVMISGLILLPVLKTFFDDSRMSTDHVWYLFYPLSFYSSIPSVFVSNNNPFYFVINMCAPALICTLLLFRKKKENILLKILLILSAIFVLIPVFGQIFNGLSYRSNRWTFSLALLFSYILVKKWDTFIKLGKSDGKFLFIFTSVFFAVCLIFQKSISADTFSGLCFLLIFITAAIIDWGKPKQRNVKEIIALLLITANIATSAFWSYSDRGSYLSKSRVDVNKIRDEFFMNDSTVVQSTADDDVVKYCGRSLSINKSLLNDFSSTYCFWSISNSNIVSFRDQLSLNDKFADQFKGYDSRSSLLALSSVNYFVTPANDKLPVPYGFTELDTKNVQSERTKKYTEELKKELGVDELTEDQIKSIRKNSNSSYTIYKNENPLPIGYCYNKAIDENSWAKMSAIERQEAMMSAVYLGENGQNSVPFSDIENSIQDIDFSVTCEDSDISFTNNAVVTTAPNKKLIFSINGKKNSETYIHLNNFSFNATPLYDMYFGSESVDPLNIYSKTNWELLDATQKAKIKKEKKYFENPATIKIEFNSSISEGTKSFEMHSKDDTFAFGKTDYLVNLGYSQDPAETIEITFPIAGVYSLDSVDIKCLPMESFNEKVNALKADSLQNVEFGTNTVTGSLTASEDEVLCVAIPYSDGWTAFVDGEETDIFHANEQYIGLNVPAGEHTIELRYSRPWKNLGYASTALGVVILAAYIVIDRIRSSKAKAKTK